MVARDILFTSNDISRWTGMLTLGTMLGYGSFGSTHLPADAGGGVIIATSLGAGVRCGYDEVHASVERSPRQAASRAILGHSTTRVGLEEIMQNKRQFITGVMRGSADLYLPLAAGFVFGLYLRYS